MRHTQSGKVALCGILGALSVVLMLMGNLIPLATYCAPMLAAILLIPVLEDYGSSTALLLYASVAILGMLIMPDKEPALIYALVLGYYPVLKKKIDTIHIAFLRVLCKIAVFSITMVFAYALLIAVFAAPELAAEFADGGRPMLVALFLMGNVAFLINDRALAIVTVIYRLRIGPKLRRILRY